MHTRRQILADAFGPEFPVLWCPVVTQYKPGGTIDTDAMRRHMKYLSRFVGGFLVPGSTGDGWSLTDDESNTVLDLAEEVVSTTGTRLLAGVLSTDPVTRLARVRSFSSRVAPDAPLRGIVVCAPAGKDRTQTEIEADLSTILRIGVPTAVYQLPQLTENEIEPRTFAALLERHENLCVFKDSSGADRIARELPNSRGAVYLRGAEGAYFEALRKNGGAYDGFLLSTANCFPEQLSSIIASSDAEAAAELSARVSSVVETAFRCASTIVGGNAFADANKAILHFMMHGVEAPLRNGPILRTGRPISSDILSEVKDSLNSNGLLPKDGLFS